MSTDILCLYILVHITLWLTKYLPTIDRVWLNLQDEQESWGFDFYPHEIHEKQTKMRRYMNLNLLNFSLKTLNYYFHYGLF